MTRQHLLAAIDRLKTWKRDGKRAPHKPLTLLWALDRGVIGLEPATGAHHLLVSNEVSGQSAAFRELLDSRGKPLRPPQEQSQRPDASFVAWHRREVFRGEPRSSPGL